MDFENLGWVIGFYIIGFFVMLPFGVWKIVELLGSLIRHIHWVP